MFERFTDRSRKVMALANQEAQRRGRECIGTEDMLLGLVREGGGASAMALQDFGVDIQKVQAEVEKLAPSVPDRITMGKLPQTPRARKAIEYAIEEARALKQHHVGTEHLLLGLLRDPEATAARILTNLGLNLDTVRARVLGLLANGSQDDRPWHRVFTWERPPREVVQGTEGSGQGPIYPPFSDRARKAMALANREAQRLNRENIGTEHILIGLMKEGRGVAATVLKGFGINVKRLRVEVGKLVQSGPGMVTMGSLPQKARAQKALEYAVEEARALNHSYIATEHVLLGLLRDPEATAARALTSLGLDLNVVRAECLRFWAYPLRARGARGRS